MVVVAVAVVVAVVVVVVVVVVAGVHFPAIAPDAADGFRLCVSSVPSLRKHRPIPVYVYIVHDTCASWHCMPIRETRVNY